MALEVVNDAQAITQLNAHDVLDNGSLEIREGDDGLGTLIVAYSLPADALGVASGTGIGGRSIPLNGEPLTEAAAASSADNATELFGYFKNSGGTIIYRCTVSTVGQGGDIIITSTSGHSTNPSKPAITAGNNVQVQEGFQFTL